MLEKLKFKPYLPINGELKTKEDIERRFAELDDVYEHNQQVLHNRDLLFYSIISVFGLIWVICLIIHLIGK